MLDTLSCQRIVISTMILTEMNLKEPVRFALENFHKVYESNGYIVLSIPPLSPPSPASNLSIIYPEVCAASIIIRRYIII